MNLIKFIKKFSAYIIVGIILLFVFVYVLALQQVYGVSMEPNYNNGDILLLNKMHYRISEPKRFEVVAIKDKNDGLMIKRVIGLPGEFLEIKNQRVYINGELLEEDFEKGSYTRDFSLEYIGLAVIPENHYFVMGDNRGLSMDSRNNMIGVIPIEDFIGKPLFRIWSRNR